MKDDVHSTHFELSLNNMAPFFSTIGCERWNYEGGGRFVFSSCLYQGLHLRGC